MASQTRNCEKLSGANATAADRSPPQSTKRALDATAGCDEVPAKRARLTKSSIESHTKDMIQELPPLQQPTPDSFRRSTGSFLRNFFDPLPKDDQPSYTSIRRFVSEWLDSVDTDRRRSCRSDSCLLQQQGRKHGQRQQQDWRGQEIATADPECPIRRTKSAGDMNMDRDTGGFASPPKPSSSQRSSQMDKPMKSATASISGASVSSKKSLVEGGRYRTINLYMNGIHMRNVDEEFPPEIAQLISDIRKDRESPDLTVKDVRHNQDLHQLEMGAGEPDVETFFTTYLFPKSTPRLGFVHSQRQPMLKRIVPDRQQLAKVSTPVPDLIYGYNTEAFSAQLPQILAWEDHITANSQDMLLPYLTVEFKGDGPGGTGSLWVATNQCLGGSATCVSMAECIFQQLPKEQQASKDRMAWSAAFAVAMNGTEARLYITWMKDIDFYMQKIRSFLLQQPTDYLAFRKYVLNIIDWGKTVRLERVHSAFDALEAKTRTAVKTADRN